MIEKTISFVTKVLVLILKLLRDIKNKLNDATLLLSIAERPSPNKKKIKKILYYFNIMTIVPNLYINHT